MNIHKNLEAIIDVAKYYAKKHNCNYNIILMNPNTDGTPSDSSTYEYVTDSYFEKERPNALLLYKTDDLLEKQEINEFEKEAFDILNSEYLSYDYINPYKYLSYSKPSTYIRKIKKINNNELCSCGSGKKFKKCCK